MKKRLLIYMIDGINEFTLITSAKNYLQAFFIIKRIAKEYPEKEFTILKTYQYESR